MKRSGLFIALAIVASITMVTVFAQDTEKKSATDKPAQKPSVPTAKGPPKRIVSVPFQNAAGQTEIRQIEIGPDGKPVEIPVTIAPIGLAAPPRFDPMIATHPGDVALQNALAEYRKAEGETEKAAKLEAVTQRVAEQFDLRQKEREAELKRLEDSLKHLRETHGKRQSEKDNIIKDRVRELVRDSEGLGWGDDPAPVNPYAPVNANAPIILKGGAFPGAPPVPVRPGEPGTL